MSSPSPHAGRGLGSSIFRLPPPRHRSTHEVVFDGAVLGAYTLSLYRGHTGAVAVLEEAPGSDLPIDLLSVRATSEVLAVLHDRRLRVFERHHRDGREIWVELELSERPSGTHIERTGETGPDKLIEALGREAFQDALLRRRERDARP